MDNSDENNKNINDKPEGEPEEIPYWLQGFEESIPDETTPIASDTNEGEAWPKESAVFTSDEDLPPDSEDMLETSSPQGDDLDGPESDDSVLDEVETETEEGSEDEPSRESDITEVLDDHEITDEIEIDAIPGDGLVEPVMPDPDELPSPEGFVDISDLDLAEPSHQEDEAFSEVEAKQGELPEWLQEMISEPETSETEDIEPDQPLDAEPIQESVEDVDISWEKEHLENELVEGELVEGEFVEGEFVEGEFVEGEHLPQEDVVDIDSSEVEQDLDTVLSSADEDTAPISTVKTEDISSDAKEPVPTELESDEQQKEFGERSEEKYTLDDLKHYLEQKEFKKALTVINELDEETTDFDEITPLLLATAENDAQDNNDLWEAIGDIAMKQEKPHDALDAYTKAIRYLLANNGDDDEIS